MPKTDINTILKHGINSKATLVDYSSPKLKKELRILNKNISEYLKNKRVSNKRLSEIVITI